MYDDVWYKACPLLKRKVGGKTEDDTKKWSSIDTH